MREVVLQQHETVVAPEEEFNFLHGIQGFPTSARGSNDAVMAQGGELLGIHAQPRAEHVVDMLAEQR